MSDARDPTETVRLLAVTVLWSLTFHVLSRYGVDLLPRAVAMALTLEEYLALVQVVTLAVGVALAFALLGEPRRILALAVPRQGDLTTVALLAPAVFVCATTIAFLVARPTLLAELIAGGTQEVQKNTGQFGRELARSPAALALLWGAVASPIGEETFFRGALWSLAHRIACHAWSSPETPIASTASEIPLEEGAVTRVISRAIVGAVAWLRTGGIATLGVAALFGLLHHDMPGGLGIVRFVAATGLGLGCGLVRQATGMLGPAVLLHVAFNALSIATVRRWVVTADLPMKWGAPTAVSAAALLGILSVAVRARLASGRNRASGTRIPR